MSQASQNSAVSAATLQHKDDVAVITLDDGKVNAFSFAMIEAIHRCLDQVPQDRGALLIRGRPGIFSAGFDLKVIRGADPERLYDLVKRGAELLWRITEHPRPVVVACSGHGVALGAFVLLMSDWRVGADGPFQIGLNEVRDGLPMPHYFSELARTRIPSDWFVRAVHHAEMFAPAQAVRPGFLDEVVPAAMLDDAAMAQARRLAKLPHPAYRIAKQRDRKPMREAAFRDFRADVSSALNEALGPQAVA